jgi:hypothetical protein
MKVRGGVIAMLDVFSAEGGCGMSGMDCAWAMMEAQMKIRAKMVGRMDSSKSGET